MNSEVIKEAETKLKNVFFIKYKFGDGDDNLINKAQLLSESVLLLQ
jgi:hypothetical protein